MKVIFYILLTLTIPINSTLIKKEQLNYLKKSLSQNRKLMILPNLKKSKQSLKLKKRKLGLIAILGFFKKLVKGIKKFFGFLFQLKTALIFGAILLAIIFCIEDSQVFCPFRIIQDILKSILGRWLEDKRVPKFIKNNKYINNLNPKDEGYQFAKQGMVRYLKDNFYDFKRSDIDKHVFYDVTKGFLEEIYGDQGIKVNRKMEKVLHLLFRNKSYIFNKLVKNSVAK